MGSPNVSRSLLFLLLVPPLCGADVCHPRPDGLPDRAYLTQCRPEPVTREEKAAVLQTLPRQGAITVFSPAQRAKLDAVDQVLHVHGRENVYEVRLIDIPQAWTGLHGRAVLLVSVPTLEILSAAELQALVAHEVGHEYLFREYEAARFAADSARLRDVETACDAIAVLTLAQLGIPAARLANAIEKVYWYNRSRFGVALNEISYPTLKQRRRLVAEFSRRTR